MRNRNHGKPTLTDHAAVRDESRRGSALTQWAWAKRTRPIIRIRRVDLARRPERLH
jgi:hypothetical protein